MANNRRKKASLGYRFYSFVSRVRHPRVPVLTYKAYKHARWGSTATVLGLRPRKMIRQVRARHAATRAHIARARRR